AAVGRPRDAIDVVADRRAVERLTAADVDAYRLPARDVVDEQIDRGVGGAGRGERFGVQSGLDLRLVQRHVVVAHVALVEAVVGELPAVRRPPHRGVLAQLLAVHPAGRPVLDAAADAPVVRDGARVLIVRGADPNVAVLVVRL